MIHKTKVNIRQGSFHLLFWGWLIFVCSLTEYLLMTFAHYSHHYYVWFLTIPGVFVSLIYGFRTGRKEMVHTYADKIYMWTWMGFMFTTIVLFMVHSKNLSTLGIYIMLLAGFPTFVSGFIIKFKPLIIGGICFWVIAIVVNYAGPSISSLGMAVAVLTGYLIPGYLLRNKVKNDAI